MYLNPEIARHIIREISPFINLDINIMDGKGLIIDSTNESRKNTFHAGGEKLISEGLSCLTVENDHQYEGCKKGINLPIFFSNKMVGVIGITGELEETMKYGQLLQKMTEMLIYENFNAVTRTNSENRNLLLVNDITHGNFQDTLFTIEERLIQANLDPKSHFTVALFRTTEEKEYISESDLFIARENIIKKHIFKYLDSKHILCAFNGEFYLAITNFPLDKFCNILNLLKTDLENSFNLSLLCAIGNEYNEYLDIPKSYNEALIVNNHFNFKEKGVFVFSNIVLNFILNQIPAAHKNNLFSQVFKSCNRTEVLDYCTFIISYFECNGSLNKLAKKNYVHKNTVQNKIQKIFTKTGLDMRICNDLFILYLASTCKQSWRR